MKTQILKVVAALTIMASAAVYVGCERENAPHTTAPITNDAGVRIFEAPEVETVVAEARITAEFQEMEQAMARQGYRPRFDLAAGGETDGTMTNGVRGAVVMVPFEKDGNAASGAVIRIVSMNDRTPSLSAAAFRAVEGELVAEQIDLGHGLGLQGAWWNCFWRCLLNGCGPGVVGCLWAGPAWWQCSLAVCGATAIVCSITC